MIPFKISLRKVGEAGQEVEVMPETPVGEIKAQQDLKGYSVRFKGPWKDDAINDKLLTQDEQAGRSRQGGADSRFSGCLCSFLCVHPFKPTQEF